MKDKEQERTLSLLKRMFPAFKGIIGPSFSQDPIFREIAREYHECIDQVIACKETGDATELYMETINELKEELMAYLNSLKSDSLDKGEKLENQA